MPDLIIIVPTFERPDALGVMFMLGLPQVATALGYFREGLPAVFKPRSE